MLVNLSEKSRAFLTEAAGMWAEVKLAIRLLRSIRGSGAVRVTTSDSGIVIHVDPVKAGPEEVQRSPSRLCLLTGRPSGNVDPRVFTCKAYAAFVPSSTTAADLNLDSLIGTEVFGSALICIYANVVGADVTSADKVYAEGVLTGYTSDEPPKPVFRAVAIQTTDCPS